MSGSQAATLPMLIGGKAAHAATGETIECVNPATGELLYRVPRGGAGEIDAAAQAAAEAFPSWRLTPVLERAAVVRRIADIVEEHGEELALLDVLDNGSPLREMRNDIKFAAGFLRYFAGLGLQLRGETVPGRPDRLNYTLMEPYGVVGRIIPFNHPMMFAAGKIAAPLVAGNTVVLKPSEHTSASALRLGEMVADAVPPGVLNIVSGTGAEAGDALVTHPTVRRLAFIGSVDIGRRIQERAAQSVVKTVTLELGGKNPLIVLPDADLDLAVEGAVRGMNFTWQGQSCGSTSRLFVEDSLHDEFVERLVARVEGLRSGMPNDEATETGAIVHRGQYEKVLSYFELGKREGARLRTGGDTPEGAEFEHGMFVRPTVFDNVDMSMRLAREEIFGPVLGVFRYSSEEEALRLANSLDYGLTASVFTRDLGRAHRFARELQAGYVWVNDSSNHFPGAPFGGVKNSGIGREESTEELYSYSQVKNVNVLFE